MRIAYSLVLLVLLVSCNKKNKIGDGILPPSSMQIILWDVLRANVLAEELVKKDSAKKILQENIRLQQEVFAIHHTDRSEFYKSYDFYVQHPELMQALLDSIAVQANKNLYKSVDTSRVPLFKKHKDSTLNLIK